MLGYLFFIGDRSRAAPALQYRCEDSSADAWYRLRNAEAMTPAAIVAQAEAAQAKFGFQARAEVLGWGG
jgi:glucarate dehydratase